MGLVQNAWILAVLFIVALCLPACQGKSGTDEPLILDAVTEPDEGRAQDDGVLG